MEMLYSADVCGLDSRLKTLYQIWNLVPRDIVHERAKRAEKNYATETKEKCRV